MLWNGAAFPCEVNMLPDWQQWKQEQLYVLFRLEFHSIANHATWLKLLKTWDACSAVASTVKQVKSVLHQLDPAIVVQDTYSH